MRQTRPLAICSIVLSLVLAVSCSFLHSVREDLGAGGKPPAPRDFKPDTNAADASVQFVSAAAPEFQYEGRFDMTDPAGPVVIWQGSRIRVDFEGKTLGLKLDWLEDQSFFDVQVDGTQYLAAVREKGAQRFELPESLARGRHHLTLFKRSEAAAGWVRFRGIELAAGAKVWPPAPPNYRLTMEFLGDSITVGACDEDGSMDQWNDRKTHDNARTYGALTAAAFLADYRNIAVSGMGVVTGWVDVRAEQIWDRVYPKATSAAADLKEWKPDVLFVNLGENDDSYSHAKNLAFPTNFANAYVQLIGNIRRAYPRSVIVLLRGGMYGGARSAALRSAWEAAVTRLEANDPAVKHFVFKHWTSKHPRVADHRLMATELIAWLNQQEFMRRWTAVRGTGS